MTEHEVDARTDAMGVLWRAAADHAEPMIAVRGTRPGCLLPVWANHTFLELVGRAPLEHDPAAPMETAPAAPDRPPATRRLNPLDTAMLHAGAVTGVLEADPHLLAGLAGGPAAELIGALVGQGFVQLERVDGVPVQVEVTVRATAAATHDGEHPEAEPLWLATLRPAGEEIDAVRSALQQAEQRFQAVAQHAPVGIFVSQAGLRLGYVNATFAQLARRSSERLLGTGWLDLVAPEDQPAFYERLETVLAGSAVQHTLKINPSGDSERWLELRLAPVAAPGRAAGFIGVAEDITSRRAWQDQLSYQLNHDPLTGLANRRRLVEALSERLASRRGRDRLVAVVCADLDGFKTVNDELGQAAGDRVLVEVARRMVRTAREDDLVARSAGDEFVILLQTIESLEDAERAVQRHLAGLAAPIRVSGRDVTVTSSFGICLPNEGEAPERILRAADHAMRQAKAAGPGQVRIAGEPVAGRPEERS
jgi:diguanylate cyclase (GGDEF)-like protein/PAS domain S-box-containing protein